jgi:hypothetical protein
MDGKKFLRYLARKFSASMRKQLAEKEGQRRKFRAVFTRLGKKTNYTGFSEETILLSNVEDVLSGDKLTDHIWFGFTKGFQIRGLREGDILEFEARVKMYEKGYVNKAMAIDNRKRDFKLSNPTKIKLIRD